MRRPLRLVALLALAFAGVAPASADAAQGGARFHRCADAPKQARCGYVVVPLDRRENSAGGKRTLRIEFEFYPRRRAGRPSLGTMVDVEGGPGYATTDSRSYYLELHDR